MKIVFSRKGFDSSSGGAPSPVLDGRPVSLPIPASGRSHTTFGDLGLGGIVSAMTSGRLGAGDLCHNDPMFAGRHCAFGQAGAAQTHLHNQGVGPGDMFLFFGLFANEDGSDRHHRIFGCLSVEAITRPGASPSRSHQPTGFPLRHPHTLGTWPENNTIYSGPGLLAATAAEELRLTRTGEAVSRWRVPPWLRGAGLSYHGRPERWTAPDQLTVASRGQEFVTRTDGIPQADAWLADILAAIRNGPTCR